MWDDYEEETPAAAAPAKAAAAPEGGAPAADGAAAPAAGSAPAPEADTPAPENPVDAAEAKKLVFKHWIRPRFLQYGYLYDYQKNYYDDVINYLDRRNKGLPTERPRAQTWGERALRTYLSKASYSSYNCNKRQDAALLRHISTGAKFQRYHSKSLISRKYSRLGFNIVSL